MGPQEVRQLARAEGELRARAVRAAARVEPLTRDAASVVVRALAREPSSTDDGYAQIVRRMARGAAEAAVRDHPHKFGPVLHAMSREDPPRGSSLERVGIWVEEQRGVRAAFGLTGEWA